MGIFNEYWNRSGHVFSAEMKAFDYLWIRQHACAMRLCVEINPQACFLSVAVLIDTLNEIKFQQKIYHHWESVVILDHKSLSRAPNTIRSNTTMTMSNIKMHYIWYCQRTTDESILMADCIYLKIIGCNDGQTYHKNWYQEELQTRGLYPFHHLATNLVEIWLYKNQKHRQTRIINIVLFRLQTKCVLQSGTEKIAFIQMIRYQESICSFPLSLVER